MHVMYAISLKVLTGVECNGLCNTLRRRSPGREAPAACKEKVKLLKGKECYSCISTQILYSWDKTFVLFHKRVNTTLCSLSEIFTSVLLRSSHGKKCLFFIYFFYS